MVRRYDTTAGARMAGEADAIADEVSYRCAAWIETMRRSDRSPARLDAILNGLAFSVLEHMQERDPGYLPEQWAGSLALYMDIQNDRSEPDSEPDSEPETVDDEAPPRTQAEADRSPGEVLDLDPDSGGERQTKARRANPRGPGAGKAARSAVKGRAIQGSLKQRSARVAPAKD